MGFQKLVEKIRGTRSAFFSKGKFSSGDDREAFFAHKKKNKRDEKKLTPLQRRMESGRA